MSKGGFRPNSGRKKGSIPWNKGLQSGNHGNGFKKGVVSWNKGKSMSIETKKKLSQSLKGRVSSRKGKYLTDGTKSKMSFAKKGKPSPLREHKIPPEIRKRMRKSRINYLKSQNPNYSPCDKKLLRKERLLKVGGFHSIGEWVILKAQYNWTCPSCKRIEPEIKLTRDHIIAITRGGSDNIENIQPLCISCNSKKATKTIKY